MGNDIKPLSDEQMVYGSLIAMVIFMYLCLLLGA